VIGLCAPHFFMLALPSALVAATQRAVACDAEQHFDASRGWRAGDWRRQAHIDGEASAANEAFLEAVADDSFENMPVSFRLTSLIIRFAEGTFLDRLE